MWANLKWFIFYGVLGYFLKWLTLAVIKTSSNLHDGCNFCYIILPDPQEGEHLCLDRRALSCGPIADQQAIIVVKVPSYRYNGSQGPHQEEWFWQISFYFLEAWGVRSFWAGANLFGKNDGFRQSYNAVQSTPLSLSLTKTERENQNCRLHRCS